VAIWCNTLLHFRHCLFFNAMMCLDLASAQPNENYYRRKMN
jgi:hypothetical protein